MPTKEITQNINQETNRGNIGGENASVKPEIRINSGSLVNTTKLSPILDRCFVKLMEKIKNT